MNHTTRKLAVAIALLALGGTSLTGCSGINDMINRRSTHTFDDKKQFSAESALKADWIPTEATTIIVRTPADKDTGVAVILLTSEASLPDSCKTAERRSAPMLSIDGAPDVYDAKDGQVHVCGSWTVMEAEHGWFGWTPNAEDQNA